MKFLFTLLLNVIGIGFLIVVIVVPIAPQFKNDSRVDTIMAAVLCNPGEHMVREPITGILSRIGIAITPTCINQQGQRRDVTTRWIVIGLGGFAVTFLFGFVLEMVLIANAIRRGIARAVIPRGNAVAAPLPMPPPPSANLSDQLRQLEDAQKAGLITFDEYEQKRQEILKKI